MLCPNGGRVDTRGVLILLGAAWGAKTTTATSATTTPAKATTTKWGKKEISRQGLRSQISRKAVGRRVGLRGGACYA